MSKVIGIVSEGPTDYLVLKAVIDKITGEGNSTFRCYNGQHSTQNRYHCDSNGW